MNNIDLNSKQWCELVFEGKNHDFGAYEMRRDSAARHNKAMLIVTILAIVVILLPVMSCFPRSFVSSLRRRKPRRR